MNKKNSNKKKTQLLMHNAFHTNCFSVSLKKKTKKKKIEENETKSNPRRRRKNVRKSLLSLIYYF